MHNIYIYVYDRICILTPTIISFMYQPFWWHRPFRIYLPSQLVDSPPSEKVLELPNLNHLTPAGVCKWHKRGFSSKQFVALFDWLDLHGYHIWSGIHILVYTTYPLYTTYPWYTTYLFHFKFEISFRGCGSGAELAFFRQRFGPRRVAGLDAAASGDDVRRGTVETMATGAARHRGKPENMLKKWGEGWGSRIKKG